MVPPWPSAQTLLISIRSAQCCAPQLRNVHKKPESTLKQEEAEVVVEVTTNMYI
jgi:hypothetical protein